jgi:hypothetical protein
MGSPVDFYCGGKKAGTANFSAGSGSVQASFSLPRKFTRVGPVSCYAQFANTELLDSATSTNEIINFTGHQVFLPALSKN